MQLEKSGIKLQSLEFSDYVYQAAEPGIGIYSASISETGEGFHIEVRLDGLEDRHGSVTIDQCTKFSMDLAKLIEETITNNLAGREALPADLSTDNFSMEISSAGAERELMVPGDLERFRGLPLKVLLDTGDKVKTFLAVYEGESDTESEERRLLFRKYEPFRKRNKNRRSKRNRSDNGNTDRGKIAGKEGDDGMMAGVDPQQIKRVNLFLDY